MPKNTVKNVSLVFLQGLGDTAQFVIVLKHLQRYRPTWRVTVQCRTGQESILRPYCHHVTTDDISSRPCDSLMRIRFAESTYAYKDKPSTKPIVCLQEEFGIPFDPAISKYSVEPEPRHIEACNRLFDRHQLKDVKENGRFPAVLIHYRGNSFAHNKNLQDAWLFPLADHLQSVNHKLLILDWTGQTSSVLLQHPAVQLLNTEDLEVGDKLCDGTNIAVLASKMSACVGIDSGPGHVFGATDTPTCIVWTRHQPVFYYDPCSNVTHLVNSTYWQRMLRRFGHAETYWLSQYKIVQYSTAHEGIRTVVAELLDVTP